MKLKNHLIVTLPDFVRYFDFTEFWLNRRQFIRDMNPDKVYYYDEKLVQAFNAVKLWIEQDDDADNEAIIQEGIAALSLLADQEMDVTDLKKTKGDDVDLSQDVITIQAGQTLSLPKLEDQRQEPINLRLHKIEVQGKSSNPAKILIGGQVVGTLREDEAVYVSEMNGGCIELLPNRLRNETWELSLLNREREFLSSLIVRNLEMGTQYSLIDCVTSFALLEDGFIYVDKNRRPVSKSKIYKVIKPKLVLKDKPVLYVKSDNDYRALMLYADGELRSSVEPVSTSGVFTATIADIENENNTIITINNIN